MLAAETGAAMVILGRSNPGADAAVTAASTILSQTVKGQVADDLLARGITEVREKLN